MKAPALLRAFCALLLLGASAAPLLAASPEELLKRSDFASAAPASFRTKLRVVAGEPPKRGASEVEVYVGGEGKTLVRFLDPKETGKFLLRRDGALWFLSTTAKPVKLTPAYRLRGGASLEDILGIRWSRDYELEKSSDDSDSGGKLAVLDLRAKSKSAVYPKIRLTIRTSTALPLRAEYRLPSGKTASVAEFVRWADPKKMRLGKLVLKDPLRPSAPTEVEFLETEERANPEGLFDLADGSSRAKL